MEFLKPLTQHELDEMMYVVRNQTAVCNIPDLIKNLVTVLKSQTILYNSCLFPS